MITITLQPKKEQIDEKTKEKTIVAEEKTYSIPFASTSSLLEYLEIEAEKENPKMLKVEDVRKIVPLIVKTYGNQFTEEEFYKGVPGYLLVPTIDEFIDSLNKDPYNTKGSGSDEGNSEKKAR